MRAGNTTPPATFGAGPVATADVVSDEHGVGFLGYGFFASVSPVRATQEAKTFFKLAGLDMELIIRCIVQIT
jgi:hypothetical protein